MSTETGTVSVSELNQRTRAVLDRVRAGERLVVTDRGRPIARLVPEEPSRWDRLVAAGQVHAATSTGAIDITPVALEESTQDIIDAIRDETA